MPLALILIGAVLLLVAVRGSHAELGKLLVDDFTGSQGAVGFFVWLAAIGVIGMLGWVPALQKPSRILLAIIIFGILASNMGVFQRLRDAIANPPSAPAQQTATAESKLPKAFPVELAGGGGTKSAAGSAIGSVAKAIPGIGSLFG